MGKALAALVSLALLLAACGDGDEAEADATTDTDVGAEDGAPGDSSAEEGEPAEDAAGGSDESAGATPAGGGGFGLNGFRYCEILITVAGDDGSPVTEVWGTPGVDPCEDEAWSALDPEAIVAEYDATSIHMNGPRYFTVDGTADTAGPSDEGVGVAAGGETEVRDFGGVSMALLATVDGPTAESAAYTPDLVVRTTTWTFNAGTEVYELTDPDGNAYLMQSYALYEDPDLTADDLPTLGDRLDLPEGWSYGARVLDADLQVALTPDGALVVTDDLGNAYQRNG